ncbi:MAG: hypothetical protein KDK27_20135, partial [Leptospiraceae bacterium]|nr:hypothetical protein [Leptospiraceae bacterium]
DEILLYKNPSSHRPAQSTGVKCTICPWKVEIELLELNSYFSDRKAMDGNPGGIYSVPEHGKRPVESW